MNKKVISEHEAISPRPPNTHLQNIGAAINVSDSALLCRRLQCYVAGESHVGQERGDNILGFSEASGNMEETSPTTFQGCTHGIFFPKSLCDPIMAEAWHLVELLFNSIRTDVKAWLAVHVC